MINKKDKLGIALVGLGEYATSVLMSALKETKNCYLAGLVSGDNQESEKWKEAFRLENKSIYRYEDFDQIAENEEIDIVYIALPNAMHAEYSIRAMTAGKHVICEKPMAINVTECEEIIKVMRQTNRRFSVGYRLHFDPFHQYIMQLGQKEVFGQVKRLFLEDSMIMAPEGQWQLDPGLAGGGPLMNNGIYCIQAAIYITGKLPKAVEARFSVRSSPFITGIEEGIEWIMYFDRNVQAICESSYIKNQNRIRVEADSGWFELAPAYEYSDLNGTTSEAKMHFEPVNQQALQMDDFTDCILSCQPSRVPAEMGLRDLKIITAIYESARMNSKIELNLTEFGYLSHR